MSISSINSSNLLSSILAAAYSPATTQSNNTSFQSSDSEDISISSIGSLMSAMSQMSADDQSSIKSFMDEIKTSTEDGSFDASALAEEAPEALQAYAEENGLDLTELVQDLSTASQGPGVYGPPPPPPMEETEESSLDLSSLEDLTDEEQTELQAFMEEMKSSIEDGTFDAATLAESAPDVLETVAEENGMSMTELIQELADEAENLPQPPMMAGANGMGNFFGQGSVTGSADESAEV